LFFAIPVWTVLCRGQPEIESEKQSKSLLNNIRANWRAEDCRQRMSRPAGRPIRRDDANSRTGHHFENFGAKLAASSVNDEVAVEFNVEFHRLDS
jgi:hypothetical protein